MTQHQDLVHVADHRLAVFQRPDVHGHHVIQVEAASSALPAGQIRHARTERLSVIDMPGEDQGRAMPNNAVGHQPAQRWRQLRRRHRYRRRHPSKRSDREVVHPNVHHSTKRVRTNPADAREYRAADTSTIAAPSHALLDNLASRRRSTSRR
jgi:hypothetical protein